MKEDNLRQNKEIDIIDLTKRVFKEYKTLGAFILVFAILGIIVALSQPKSYTTNVVLAPEISSGIGISSGISDLASMVGVDLSSNSNNVDAIYPEIYPDIFASTDFILTVLNIPVKTLNGTHRTYNDHLILDQKYPFWVYPQIWATKLFKKKNINSKTKKLDPFHLTKGQYNIVAAIRTNISCLVDKKTSVITIAVKDQDPMVSAIVADTLCNKLQNYITIYRTKKARNDLAYTEKLYKEAKAQYEKSRRVYAGYSDANTDIIVPSYKSKEEDLENEMQLRFNTYTQMSQQLQLAKAKLQERTPAFTVIQKASIPIKASSTPRLYTLIAFILIGVLFDALWILYLKEIITSRTKKKEA